MNEIESKHLQQIEKVAARWVEEELAKRMAHARDAIEEQVNIAMPEVGPARAGDHLKKAIELAQENIRMDLEVEAEAWIRKELEKRQSALREK